MAGISQVRTITPQRVMRHIAATSVRIRTLAEGVNQDDPHNSDTLAHH